jgi:type VI secretion system protein
MKITLTVIQAAGAAPSQSMSVTFDQQGGSIGRKDENDWTLPDPERFISGRHALISFSHEVFYLTDISSNGVFLNHATNPLGKNNQVALHDGDTITIGEYEISVALQQAASQALPTPDFSDFEGLSDPFAQLAEKRAGQPLEQAFPAASEFHHVEPPIPDQIYTLDESEPSDLLGEESPQQAASQANHTSDLNACFNQPAPIPEDWDLDDEKHDSPQQNRAAIPEILPPLDEPPILPPEPTPPLSEEITPQEAIPRPGLKANRPPPTPPPEVKPPPSPTVSSDEASLRQALAEGLGAPKSQFEDIPLTDLLRNLGQVLRTSVNGSISLLRARTQMKGEFRMNQTMIQPVENNPLKFSINTEEALRHIINPHPESGFLTPLAAFEEAHEDIEAHMLAVMVGMQAALQVVLQRFKPEILEKRLGQSALLEKISLYREAKTWELFTQLYSEIANEAEDDFHQLFGHTFSQAYEEQIRRLKSLKRSDPD